MNDLDPKSFISQLMEHKSTFAILLVAMWGGTASYIAKIKANKTKFKVFELLGEWCISGFSGLLTVYICFELELSWQMTAFMAGIAGHMGGRAITIFENRFKRFAGDDKS